MLDVPMYRSPATYPEKEKYFLLQLLLQIQKSTKIVLFFCSFLVCLWCLLCVLLRCPLEDHTGWLMCPWATASTVGSTKSTFSLSSTLHPSTDILHVLTMEVVLPLAMAMSRYILSRDDSSPRIGTCKRKLSITKKYINLSCKLHVAVFQLAYWLSHLASTWKEYILKETSKGCFQNLKKPSRLRERGSNENSMCTV